MRPLASLWKNRVLIWRLARREVEARFRGSFLGLFWAVIAPLAMLGVYSLVFGSIFKARWSNPTADASGTDFHFPMLLFLGIILFGIVADPLNRAAGLVLENVSYVKKVVFPLEVLPIVSIVSAIFTAGLSLAIFLIVYVILYGLPPATILFLPVAVLPLLLVTLGIVYFLSSLGVFLRDLRHVVPLVTTTILFLSSIFIPPESVPPQFKLLFDLNPLTHAVNDARDLAFWGRIPNVTDWLVYLLLSAMIFMLGMYWFKRTQKAFADVV